MLDNAAATSLIPQLMSLLRGNEIKEAKAEFPVVYMQMDDDEHYSDVSELSSASQFICVLSIKGPLFKHDQMCGPMGTRSMTRLMKEWEANDSVVGVVLDIDCPGGQVSGLSEFANFIHGYSKPVVSYTDGYQCSAAEYVAGASKWKIANKHADLIGSIGTMLKYVDLDGIIESQGGVIRDIYATKSPRKNEEDRELKKGSDALIIKNIIDPLRDVFVSDMKKFCPGIKEEVFDGAIYMPSEALSMGLIDEIGTIQNAFDKVVGLSKEKPKKSNSKSNLNMSKKLPKLEAVLGLDAPLAITDKGSYLNETQLDSVESEIGRLETENSSLTTQLTEAKNNTELQEKLTASESTVTGLEASVDAMLAESGIPAVSGQTLDAKMAALDAKVKAMAKAPGAVSTNLPIDADKGSGGKTKILSGIDVSAALNN